MRFRWMLGACSFAAIAAACGDGAAATPDGGALVLEVGGDHSSLRRVLQEAGVQLPADPSRQQQQQQQRGDDSKRDDPDERRGHAAPDEPPSPPSPSPRPAADAFFTVELAENQTIVQLARKHLGNGSRFVEILELNGWTEADSRRLRVGQQVKIPRSTDAAQPRR